MKIKKNFFIKILIQFWCKWTIVKISKNVENLVDIKKLWGYFELILKKLWRGSQKIWFWLLKDLLTVLNSKINAVEDNDYTPLHQNSPVFIMSLAFWLHLHSGRRNMESDEVSCASLCQYTHRENTPVSYESKF